MPLVPKFCLSQDDEFVKVSITIPFVKVSDLELIADGTDFSFYCRPYLLRLTLPHEVIGSEHDERCKAVYDCNLDNGTVTAYLPKQTAGQHFPDLDLITQLMAPQMPTRRNGDSKPPIPCPTLIEVIGSSSDSDIGASENNDIDVKDDTIGSLETRLESLLISKLPRYGFNLQYSGVLGYLREESIVMLDITDPDGIAEASRRSLRIESEYAAFDAERYLGDCFGAAADPLYADAMAYSPFWVQQWDTWKAGTEIPLASSSNMVEVSSTCDETADKNEGAISAAPALIPLPTTTPKDTAFDTIGGFSDNERLVLSGGSAGSGGLRNKEFLIGVGTDEEHAVLLGLADLLFAFCHEYRLVAGEPTVESATNISRLSCSLSWLDWFSCERGDDISTVITHCARRSLIYPYLRYWKLTRKALTDVCKVLILGRRCVLKCLLQLRSIFERTSTHYILNRLFVDDYCVWVQQVSENTLQRFAKSFNDMKNKFEGDDDKGKGLVELNLTALEAWAEQQQEEEEEDEDDDDDDNDNDDDDDDDDDVDDDVDDGDKNDVSRGCVPHRLLPKVPPSRPPMSPTHTTSESQVQGIVASLLNENIEDSNSNSAGSILATSKPLIIEISSSSTTSESSL